MIGKSAIFPTIFLILATNFAGCSGTGVEEASIPGNGASGNIAPSADAGTLQNASKGSLVTLDGSGSADADGDLLTYRWSFLSMPDGSSATLSNSTVVSPTFTPDAVGDYIAQLAVDDERGGNNVAQVTVAVGVGNIRPIAHAGRNQRVPFRPDEGGAPVLLDAGKSTDANGDALAYEWTLQRPKDSLAELSDRTAEKPTFRVDKAGDYDITLTVKDKTLTSLPAKVKVIASIINVPPVARAGDDQTVSPGATVTLTGVGTDANPEDAAKLTYTWTLVSKPSSVPPDFTLNNPTSSNPTFTAILFDQNESGRVDEYVVGLTVSDGRLSSIQDNVVIRATHAPTANAGLNRTVGVGDAVALTGQVTNATEFNWKLEPPANGATLSNTGTLTPEFRADLVGTYSVTLEAIKKSVDGVPLGEPGRSTITITAAARPEADPRTDPTVAKVCSSVQLTGNPGGMSSYAWTFTVPDGGTAISTTNAQSPSFKPDQSESTYRATLIVSNGQLDSPPKSVDITVQDQGLGQLVYDEGPDLAGESDPRCGSCHSAGSHDTEAENSAAPDLRSKVKDGLSATDIETVLTTGKLVSNTSKTHPGGTASITNDLSCRIKQLRSFLAGLSAAPSASERAGK